MKDNNTILAVHSPTEAASDLAAEIASLKIELAATQRQVRASSKAEIAVMRDSLPDVLKAMHRASENENDHMKAGHIYCKEVKPLFEGEFVRGNSRSASENWIDVMRCANTLGTLNGELIAQRCLDLLRYELPVLSRITTDFSAEPVKFNQEVATRLRAVPGVTVYDPVNGYSDSPVTDTDVFINVNQHKAVQIVYSANDLSSTTRLLFPEQEEGMHFAIALDIVNGLTALMTLANYPNPVAGALGYGNPQANSQTICPLDQFARPTVIGMKSALNLRGATGGVRTLLLQEPYHGQLETDTTIVGNLINPDAGSSIMAGTLPIIAGFKPMNAPYLPANGINLQGFGFRADALAMALRLPNDYSKVFPGVTGGGVVKTVTNPDSGMSVMVAMFLDHKLAQVRLRVAWMWGCAVGDPAAGQILTGS
jgi:hypothetical protein